jgi:hypothetical protein
MSETSRCLWVQAGQTAVPMNNTDTKAGEVLDLRSAAAQEHAEKAERNAALCRDAATTDRLPARVGQFRLAASIPGPNDGTSLMRGLGPLSAMRQEDPRLEIVLPPQAGGHWDLNWSWIAGCDALFLQRPHTKAEARAAVMAKMMGKPVWVDWDDDLTCVPIYNHNHHLFDPDQVLPVLNHLCKLADVVTCSTTEVKRRREEEADHLTPALSPKGGEGGKFQVIPNACMWPMAGGPRERRILWRGGNNHEGDLMFALPALVAEARRPQNSLWKWLFVGDICWQVVDEMPSEQLELDQGADPFLYMQILQHSAPYAVIAPLRDNAFNRCRSNLAWLEGTAAGAVVIAPDWEEWHRPGVINYTDAEALRRQLRGVMEQYALGVGANGERAEHSNVAMSRAFIEANLTMKTVNEKRWEILNRMIAGK